MKKQIILIMLCLIAVVVSVSAVSAANVYVNDTTGSDSGTGTINDPFQTIGKGVDNSAENDTVIIANGVYTGSNNRNITISKNINITGQSQNGTIISATHVNWIFTVDKCNVTFRDLTLQNAFAQYGSALYNYGNCTVIDCAFTNNTADNGEILGNGGAIYNDYASMIITNCIFTGNHANNEGGAIYSRWGPLSITGSIFTDNSAYHGGAICGGVTTLDIIGCNFNKNIAGYRGGAIYNNNGILNVKYSRFVGNNATYHGKDIYSTYGDLQSATLNWWGSNSGPAEGRIAVDDTIPEDIVPLYTPWLVMNIKADPSTIYAGQTSKITADVYRDSNGADYSNDADQFFSGPEVTFATDLGNVGSKSVTVPWALGLATAILRGDEGAGIATVTAADVQVVSTTVTITPVTNAASSTSRTIGMQETGAPIVPLAIGILALIGGLAATRRK